MSREDDHSVSQTGDTNVIGAVSFGDDSRATHIGDIAVDARRQVDVRRVQEMLDQLLRDIDRHEAQLREPQLAVSAARVLRDEVGQVTPDKAVVRRILDRLAAAVRAVAPLLEVTGEVAAALKPWLS